MSRYLSRPYVNVGWVTKASVIKRDVLERHMAAREREQEHQRLAYGNIPRNKVQAPLYEEPEWKMMNVPDHCEDEDCFTSPSEPSLFEFRIENSLLKDYIVCNVVPPRKFKGIECYCTETVGSSIGSYYDDNTKLDYAAIMDGQSGYFDVGEYPKVIEGDFVLKGSKLYSEKHGINPDTISDTIAGKVQIAFMAKCFPEEVLTNVSAIILIKFIQQ
jgi:hypothetical protein